MARDAIEKMGRMLTDLGQDKLAGECFKESARRFDNVGAAMSVGQPAKPARQQPQPVRRVARGLAEVQELLGSIFIGVPGVGATMASLTEASRATESQRFAERAEAMVVENPGNVESTHMARRMLQVAHLLDPENSRVSNPVINFLIKSSLAASLNGLLQEEECPDLQLEVDLACEISSSSELWAVTWPVLEANGLFAGGLRLLDAMRGYLSTDEYSQHYRELTLLHAVSGGFGRLAHCFGGGAMDPETVIDEEPRLREALAALAELGHDPRDIRHKTALLGMLDLRDLVNRRDWEGAVSILEQIITAERLDSAPAQIMRDLHSRYCALAFFLGLCDLIGGTVVQKTFGPVAKWLDRMREFNPDSWQVPLQEIQDFLAAKMEGK